PWPRHKAGRRDCTPCRSRCNRSVRKSRSGPGSHTPARCPHQIRAPKKFAVVSEEDAVFGTAEAVRLVQYRIEDGLKVAGRGVDNLQYLGGRALLSERLVALRCAFRARLQARRWFAAA